MSFISRDSLAGAERGSCQTERLTQVRKETVKSFPFHWKCAIYSFYKLIKERSKRFLRRLKFFIPYVNGSFAEKKKKCKYLFLKITVIFFKALTEMIPFLFSSKSKLCFHCLGIWLPCHTFCTYTLRQPATKTEAIGYVTSGGKDCSLRNWNRYKMHNISNLKY